MSKFWVIVSETYRKNVKSASFIVMLLSPILLLLVGGVISYLVTMSSEESKLAIIAENPEIRQSFVQNKGTYKVDKKIQTEEQAQKALEQEKIDGYFVISEKGRQLQGELFVSSTGDQKLTEELVQQLTMAQSVKVAKQLALSAEDLAALQAPAQVQSKIITFKDGKAEEKDNDSMVMTFMAMAVSVLIFMFVIFYASIIGQEIASEKGTRIMEIILSSTKATTQFYGKLVGILFVCLTQIAVYAVIGIAGYFGGKNNTMVQSIMKMIPKFSIKPSFIFLSIAFFLIGMILYAIIAALFGSLVSKTEDVAKAIQPLTFLAMIGFYVGYFVGLTNPSSQILTVFSYIPFFSPFTMPFRMANETVSLSGEWVSLFLLVLGTGLLAWVSGLFYRSSVLVYGDGSLWKNFRQSIVIWKNEQ